MIYGTVTSNIKFFLNQVGDPWVNVQKMSDLVPGLINLALVVATIVFFFLLLFGGIRWITAGGDKTSLEAAQKMLTSAIVGIIIVLSAWAIKDFVWKFFGLTGTAQVQGCTPQDPNQIGNDGDGGCCGVFKSKEGNSCDSGNANTGGCRPYEQCRISNGRCASETSCCAKDNEGCLYSTDCCSTKCVSKKCVP